MSGQEQETALVTGIRNGDEASYRQLVESYWHDLNYSAQRILKGHTDSSDCVQEGLIKAIERIDSYSATGSFKAWLHRIIINEALMLLRKRNTRKEHSLDEFMLEFDENGAYREHYLGQTVTLEVLQESKEVKEQVRLAIEKLPDNFRVTLLLRDIDGFSTKETAEIMETTEENVKVRLHRARLALRNLLKPMLREESNEI